MSEEIMKEQVLKIIKAADSVARDNLHRAEHAFKHHTDEQMLENYGQSGNTCKSILDGYKEAHEYYEKCYEWVLDNC